MRVLGFPFRGGEVAAALAVLHDCVELLGPVGIASGVLRREEAPL